MKRLKKLRELGSVNQDTIAKYLGVGRSTVSRYETGEREPDFQTAQKLADYFNVTVDCLLGRTDDPTPLTQKSVTPEQEQPIDEDMRVWIDTIRSLHPDDETELFDFAEWLKTKRNRQ